VSGLARVSFKTGRARLPRLSPPRVIGKQASHWWTDAEKKIIKKYYPKGGSHACLAHLGPHRTPSGVYQQACKLGLTTPHGAADYKGENGRVVAPPRFDDELRAFYQNGDGKKRGECNAFADKCGLPRWWVTKRATKLGLVMPHRKEPPWTVAEVRLVGKVPLHDIDKCAKIFRQHGFARSPTAIKVKATRLGISRRFNEGCSLRQASEIVGFDSKNFGTMVAKGEVKARRRADRRLPQQGGSRWIIKPADLRRFVLDNLDRIDLRKVEKFAFVQLIANERLSP
jgi:hypothetical protein